MRLVSSAENSSLDWKALFLKDGNLDLTPPLTWKVYGDKFTIKK